MTLLVIMMMAIAAARPLSTGAANPGKILVAYFSWGGNTETVARHIAEQTQGDLFEIEPAVPYPAEYTPCTEVALKERDNNARPAIRNKVENWDDYEVVFIGCPVWWHEAPMIIHTFAESYDFQGKTVVPFCTYASTYRDETLAKIAEITPAARHLEGFGARSRNTAGVTEWLDRIGLLPTEDTGGPQAIDLGISVRWAPFNIGATAPEEYGTLYGWADPTGRLLTERPEDYPSATPPADICGTSYDIATANWGAGWRMPTQAECEELATKCRWEWTTMNGTAGMKVTGDNDNYIFLPAAASRTGESISGQAGQRGNYWSGTLWPGNSDFASYLYFYQDAARIQPARSGRRYVGMSVRAVSNSPQDITGIGAAEAVDTDDGLTVSTDGNIVTVGHLKAGTAVEIYDTAGRRVYRGLNRRISLEGKGIYLLKAGHAVRKIRI